MTAPTNTKKDAPPEGKTAKKTKKKHYDVFFYRDWCKACGICVAFCPQKIISADATGKPSMLDSDKCVGCRFCEIHCPDFAITVVERSPKRRKTDV